MEKQAFLKLFILTGGVIHYFCQKLRTLCIELILQKATEFSNFISINAFLLFLFLFSILDFKFFSIFITTEVGKTNS